MRVSNSWTALRWGVSFFNHNEHGLEYEADVQKVETDVTL